MAAQAGERVKETGDYYCTRCNAKVHVEQGDRIPMCPQGHHQFRRATAESDPES